MTVPSATRLPPGLLSRPAPNSPEKHSGLFCILQTSHQRREVYSSTSEYGAEKRTARSQKQMGSHIPTDFGVADTCLGQTDGLREAEPSCQPGGC